MARTINRPMSARFMGRSLSCWPALLRRQYRDAQVGQRRLLCALELDQRLAVVQDRIELVALRRRQIALGENHVVVGRHADLELALFRFEGLLRQLARRLRRLDALDAAL